MVSKNPSDTSSRLLVQVSFMAASAASRCLVLHVWICWLWSAIWAACALDSAKRSMHQRVLCSMTRSM